MLRTLRALASDLIIESVGSTGASPPPPPRSPPPSPPGHTTLTQLHGIGHLLAGKILALVGSIDGFRSAAAFASYTGTPDEASSDDFIRHRLSRARNRQLNHCLHIMAITQISHDTPGAYYQTKRAAGKSHREALQCLKRRLSDAVSYATHTPTPRRVREDTRGRLRNPARPAQPLPPTLRTSHSPDPPTPTLPTPHQDSLDAERRRSARKDRVDGGRQARCQLCWSFSRRPISVG